MSLGWLLTPLKPAIEREITAQLDKLLGDGLTARARVRRAPRRLRQPERQRIGKRVGARRRRSRP